MNNIKQPCVYKIERNSNLKVFIIPAIIILIAIITIIVLVLTKPSPKSIVKSFLNALQDYDTDKVVSCVDFDSMVMLTNTSNDINNLDSNLNHLSSQSSDEQSNFKESVSYTKRHFASIIDGLRNDNILFFIGNLEIHELTDEIYEVIANLTLKNDNASTTDIMTFYVKKFQNKYRIIYVTDKFYF